MALALVLLAAAPARIADQDVLAIVERGEDAPRWIASLVHAPHGTSLAPTFTYRVIDPSLDRVAADAPDARARSETGGEPRARQVALAAADPDAERMPEDLPAVAADRRAPGVRPRAEPLPSAPGADGAARLPAAAKRVPASRAAAPAGLAAGEASAGGDAGTGDARVAAAAGGAAPMGAIAPRESAAADAAHGNRAGAIPSAVPAGRAASAVSVPSGGAAVAANASSREAAAWRAGAAFERASSEDAPPAGGLASGALGAAGPVDRLAGAARGGEGRGGQPAAARAASTATRQAEPAPPSVAFVAGPGAAPVALAAGVLAAPPATEVGGTPVRAVKSDRLATVALARAPAARAGTLVDEKPLIAAPAGTLGPRTTFVRAGDAAAGTALALDPGAGGGPGRIVIADRERFHAASAAATSASMLSAYAAGERVGIDEPFRLLLGTGDLPHGVSGNGLDHWWSDRPLPDDITSKKERKCLAEAVYFEARGEPEEGQRAVAQVVINRVKNPAYPDTVCGVVYQNRNWFNRCQFTFACDRIRDRVTDRAAWALAERIAEEYVTGTAWLPEIGAATHYHADYVSPSWAELMRKVRTIGDHLFYVTYGGGWT